jgi:putative methionine-R-sulfoxide reductase with GAF domain/ligand-binding sensor domain-containing protein
MKYLKKYRVTFVLLHSFCCVLFSLLVRTANCQTVQPKFVHLAGSRAYTDIKTILPDSKNFLWFGCNQGLVRFNGSNYIRYAPGSGTKTISSGNITALYEDEKGTIWIGTADKGLFRYSYSSDSFIQINNTDGFAVSAIQSFQNDLLVTANKEAFVFSTDKSELKLLAGTEQLKKNNTTVVKCIAGNSINEPVWLLCSDGLYKCKGGVLAKVHNYPYSVDELGNALKTLNILSDGTIYSATKNIGLVEFSAATNSTTVYPFSSNTGKAYSSNNADALIPVGDNQLLISTQEAGLAVFNTAQKEFSFLTQDNFPESDIFNFRATAFNSNKTHLVFATQSKGIWVYNMADAGRFTSVRVASTHNKVPGTLYARSILPLPEKNTIYIGSFYGDGLYEYNTASGKTQSFPFIKNKPAAKTLIINHIYKDKSGVIWLASHENGLLIFDADKKMIISAAEKFPALSSVTIKKIYCIYEDKSQSLYIGTGGDGLAIVNRTRNEVQKYLHNEKAANSILTDSIFAEKFFEDNRGDVWVSTIRGISVFQPSTSQFYNFTNEPEKANSIPRAFWYAVEQDNAGNIFIGTNAGLYKIKPGERSLTNAKHYSDNDGLLHNNVYSIIKDKQGLLWVTCRNGISCFNPADETFRNFTYKNGLPAKTLMSPMSLAADGNIYHGSVENFFSFNTSLLLEKEEQPKVWFTGLKIFNKDTLTGLELNNKETIRLGYTQHSFSFSFTSPALLYPDAVSYSYMLEGVDKTWIMAGNRNYATYTNIKPGTYTFKVKASEKAENNLVKSITIIIATPFWQRWWFILLCGLAGLFVVYLFIRKRDRAIKKREAEKTEIEKLKAINYRHQLEVEQVLWDVTKNCISKLGFEDCVIYLADDEKKVLIQKAAWGPKTTEENKITNPIKIPLGKGIVGAVALNNKAEIINDTSKDRRYIVDDASRLSEISVPINSDDKVLGVIDSENSQKNFYTEKHLQVLVTIASLLANRIVKIKAEQLAKEKEIEVLTLKASNFQYQLEVEKIVSFFATAISSHHSVDDMLWDISKNLIGQLGFEECMIYLWNDDKTVLMQKAGYGLKGDMKVEENKNVYHVPKGKGIVGAAAESGESILVNDTSKDKRYFSADAKIMFSELCVPIMQKNEAIGVINTEHSKKNFFTQRHLKILATIASLCADKIDKINAEQQTRVKEVEVFKLNKELAESQLTALRAQMNPHFIFNALNSVQQYILQGNIDEANRYLSKFSKLQREILNNSDQSFISLEKEKEILELYLQLEQLRFNGNFEYSIIIDDEIDITEIKIPPMLVQPFVENAIWHGLMPKQGERKVQIKFRLNGDMLECLIADNGIGREAAAMLKEKASTSHQSKGMAIVNERLKILRQQYQQPFEVSVTDIIDAGNNLSGTQVLLKIYAG